MRLGTSGVARAFPDDRRIGSAISGRDDTMLRTIRNATLAATLLAAPATLAFAATGGGVGGAVAAALVGASGGAAGTGSAGTLGSATGRRHRRMAAAERGAPSYAAAPTTNPDTQLGGNSPLNTNPGANSNLNGMAAGSQPRAPWVVRPGADGIVCVPDCSTARLDGGAPSPNPLPQGEGESLGPVVRVQRMMISTRRFWGSRTPGPVATSRCVSPKPWMLMAPCGTPSRTSSPATAWARLTDSP